MRTQVISRFLLSVAIAALGCRTAAIPEPTVIAVPRDLTAQQREVAIYAGILNTPPPRSYDPSVEMPADEFDRFLWQEFTRNARKRGWLPDSREASTIYAAIENGGFYLRAAIEHETSSIRVRIVESRNFSQSRGRIHRRAIKWARNLEARIRREVGRMSVFNRSHAPG